MGDGGQAGSDLRVSVAGTGHVYPQGAAEEEVVVGRGQEVDVSDPGNTRSLDGNAKPPPIAVKKSTPTPTRILWPHDIFRQAAQPGLSNISTDRSRVPRYVPMLFESGGMIVPSFALAGAAAALNTDPVLGKDLVKLRARSVSLDLGYHLPLLWAFRQLSRVWRMARHQRQT
jgi:hypothetical protein